MLAMILAPGSSGPMHAVTRARSGEFGRSHWRFDDHRRRSVERPQLATRREHGSRARDAHAAVGHGARDESGANGFESP